MTFDPKKHIIRIQGNREYLPVAARLIWFRQDHPDWGIVTSPVEINMEKQYAIFSCSIFNEDGKLMATATKMENVRGFQDYLEKAETGSVGRALAYVGYGTQFAPELEEESRFADAPYSLNPRTPSGYDGAGGGGNGNGGRPANGNGATARRPSAPPPTASAPAPVSTPAPAPPQAAAAAANGSGITRVREPDRAAPPPTVPDEDDEDDFFEEDEPFAEPAAADASPIPAAEAAPPRPNPLAGNRCSVEGCSNVLTAGQMTMSMTKFGRPVCLLHQKDMQPLAAAAPAGNGRRAAAKVAETEDEYSAAH